MLGIQIPSVALKHLIPNFYVFQSLTCSQLLQGTPGSLMKMLLVLPKMIFSFIEEIRPRRERKVQVCWQNVREMNKAGSFFPISGFSPETEDPITCSPPPAPSSGFHRLQLGWQQKGTMQGGAGPAAANHPGKGCCQHWGARLWWMTAAQPRDGQVCPSLLHPEGF